MNFNRLIRSAIFPIVVIIVLILVAQTFIPFGGSTKTPKDSVGDYRAALASHSIYDAKIDQAKSKLTYHLKADLKKSYTTGVSQFDVRKVEDEIKASNPEAKVYVTSLPGPRLRIDVTGDDTGRHHECGDIGRDDPARQIYPYR